MEALVPAVEAFLSGNCEAVQQAHSFLLRVLDESPVDFIESAIVFLQDSPPQSMASLFLFMMNFVFRSDSRNSLRSLIPAVVALGISIAPEVPASAVPAVGALLTTLARKFSVDIRFHVIRQILDSIRPELLQIVAFLCEPSLISPVIAIEVLRAIHPFLEASDEPTTSEVLQIYKNIAPALLPALPGPELELFCSEILALPGPTTAWYEFWSGVIEFVPIHIELFECIVRRSIEEIDSGVPSRHWSGYWTRGMKSSRLMTPLSVLTYCYQG
jgi:hypothetical protein